MNEMRIARLVYYSPNIEPYADSIAAVVQQYRPDRIEIAFPDMRSGGSIPHRGREQSEFIKDLHTKLSAIGNDVQCYRVGETIEIIPISCSENDPGSILQGATVVDVTTIPKKLSVEIVAAALKSGSTRVCALTWLSIIKGKDRLRVGKDAYDYIDLTRLEETADLKRSYAARATLLISMGAVILLVSLLAVLSHWVPELSIANEILISVSVAAGFAGLYTSVKGK